MNCEYVTKKNDILACEKYFSRRNLHNLHLKPDMVAEVIKQQYSEDYLIFNIYAFMLTKENLFFIIIFILYVENPRCRSNSVKIWLLFDEWKDKTHVCILLLWELFLRPLTFNLYIFWNKITFFGDILLFYYSKYSIWATI